MLVVECSDVASMIAGGCGAAAGQNSHETTSLADWIIAVATRFAAVGSVVAAIYAAKAARASYQNVRNDRSDQCYHALEVSAAKIGKVISRVNTLNKGQSADDTWLTLDDAWSAWSIFRASYYVAARYYVSTTNVDLERGEKVLKKLESYSHSREGDGASINAEFGEFAGAVRESLSD
jgi:hypothetical protein